MTRDVLLTPPLAVSALAIGSRGAPALAWGEPLSPQHCSDEPSLRCLDVVSTIPWTSLGRHRPQPGVALYGPRELLPALFSRRSPPPDPLVSSFHPKPGRWESDFVSLCDLLSSSFWLLRKVKGDPSSLLSGSAFPSLSSHVARVVVFNISASGCCPPDTSIFGEGSSLDLGLSSRS